MTLPPDSNPETLLQHFAEEEKFHGAVVPPIFQNSLFAFDTFEEFYAAWSETPEGPPAHYSRIGNPTLSVVEKKLAMLEHTEAAKVMNSGMAAISAAVFSVIEAGAHVVAVQSCYGPSRTLFSEYLPKFNVEVTYVDGCDPNEFIDAIRPNTKLVYLESPSSAVFKLQDLETIARACKARGIATICDNSYATPLYQNPADFGVDIVVHTASKYLGGHSDITGGVICTTRDRIAQMVKPSGEIPLFGGVMAPFPAWLMLRGMRTLGLRVKHHEETANQVARWLETRPEVERVLHVSLPSFPQKELYAKQMRGSGGLLSFLPKVQDRDRILAFINSLKIFQIGVSWGGFESLALPIPFPPMAGPDDPIVIRIYCGLEDVEDLIRDIEGALKVLSPELEAALS
jgi:cystathionine beta-lyase